MSKIGKTLHALVYTKGADAPYRIISLRKATAQEREAYRAAGGT